MTRSLEEEEEVVAVASLLLLPCTCTCPCPGPCPGPGPCPWTYPWRCQRLSTIRNPTEQYQPYVTCFPPHVTLQCSSFVRHRDGKQWTMAEFCITGNSLPPAGLLQQLSAANGRRAAPPAAHFSPHLRVCKWPQPSTPPPQCSCPFLFPQMDRWTGQGTTQGRAVHLACLQFCLSAPFFKTLFLSLGQFLPWRQQSGLWMGRLTFPNGSGCY